MTSAFRSTRRPTRSAAGSDSDSGSDSVPILAFHAVERGPGPLCFPPERFAALVARLRRRGVVALTAGDAARRLANGDPLPERPVVFTFDDAYVSVHDQALPILADAGYPGTVFAVTGRLGGINDWDPPGSAGHGLCVMSAVQLVALHQAGWEIGGHSHNHRRLVGLSEPEVRREIASSSEYLQTLLGCPVPCFAYPFGEMSPMVRRVAAESHDACFAIGAACAGRHSPADAIERVEAWYLRTSWSVEHLHSGVGTAHLAARRVSRRVGRQVRRFTAAVHQR